MKKEKKPVEKVYCSKCRYNKGKHTYDICSNKKFFTHEDTCDEHITYYGNRSTINTKNNCKEYQPKKFLGFIERAGWGRRK